MECLIKKSPHRFVIIGGLIALIVTILDYISKSWILNHFTEFTDKIIVAPFFQMDLVWNRGVSFGFLAFNPDESQYILAGIAGVITLLVIIWLFKATKAWQSVALGLVIGGGIGNIIDRFQYGAVLDFIDIFWKDYHWPSFNLADSAISVGVCMILIDLFFGD